MSTIHMLSRGDEWQTKPLASVVERIFVGIPTSRHAAKPGEGSIVLPILSVGNIDDRHMSSIEAIPKVELRAGDFERFQVHPGDILLSCRGTLLKAAPVLHELRGALASSNIITIRPKISVILPQLILALLRSPPWQETLRSRTRSSTGLMQLTVKDLEDLPVPVPRYELQVKLAELIDAEDRAYRNATAAANMRRALVESFVTRTLLDHSREKIS